MIKYSIGKYPIFACRKKMDDIISIAVRSVSKHTNVNNKQFDLSFISNKKIKQINKKYRNKNQKTDVISFAFCDSEKVSTTLLGEVFICYSVAKQNAKKYHHSIEREVSFLVIHGLLHLLGWDHQKKEDEIKMIKVQKEIMTGLNILK